MNLHEYQGKQLFAEYGLPVSKGYAVDTPEAAAEACDKIGRTEWVVKARFTQVVVVKRAASSWFAARKMQQPSLNNGWANVW